MKKSALALLLFAGVLAACSVQHTSGGTAPKEAKGGFLGLSKADAITVETPDAFKGKKEVIIGSFKIGFLEEKKESSKAGGGFGGRSSAHLKMNGVTTEVMQQITDAAYNDFVSKLKAAGYSVADRSPLLSSKEFGEVSSDVSPLREEASFFGSKNTLTYLSPTALGNKIYWHGEQGRMGGFAFANTMLGASTYADKAKTPVVFVSYLVDFANAEGSGGRFSATSSIEVGQGLSVAPGGGVWIFGGQGGTFSNTNGAVKLGQAVYSTDSYGEIVKTSSDAAVAAETALNVATAVLGGGTNQSRSFEINADVKKYKAVSNKVLGEANSALTGKMGELRQ
jgi:hypothetical protein